MSETIEQAAVNTTLAISQQARTLGTLVATGGTSEEIRAEGHKSYKVLLDAIASCQVGYAVVGDVADLEDARGHIEAAQTVCAERFHEEQDRPNR